MTDISNPEYDYQEEPVEEPQESSGIASLRKAFEENRKKVRDLERDLALSKAGIPEDHPALPLFQKADDVDWSAPDKVREAAERYGLLTPQTTAPEVPADEQQAHARMSDAVTTGESIDPNADKPWLKPGLSKDEAMALYSQHKGFANLQ